MRSDHLSKHVKTHEVNRSISETHEVNRSISEVKTETGDEQGVEDNKVQLQGSFRLESDFPTSDRSSVSRCSFSDHTNDDFDEDDDDEDIDVGYEDAEYYQDSNLAPSAESEQLPPYSSHHSFEQYISPSPQTDSSTTTNWSTMRDDNDMRSFRIHTQIKLEDLDTENGQGNVISHEHIEDKENNPS